MFRKLLIANRGEIALRVIRTARVLGIRSVAVFSEVDADAPHVWLADEAVPVGPAPAAESYLNAQALLAAARSTGAEALHPGYGFLSENAEFARAVEEAGLTFVGPAPATLEAVGEKTVARRRMQAAGVPVVPGSDGALQDAADALRVAREVGWPVLLKPAGGGGGKGMRRVDGPHELEREYAAAAREAEKGFANPTLYLERHLGRVRHLEVQILGTGGGVVALGVRECSIQRRHQKVIEETPSPVTAGRDRGAECHELAERLLEAARRAGEAVGYRNAGTVEFLLDATGRIHFIEVNARLQVEHPVTELVTGLDLVEAQLRIAAGESLPASFLRPDPRGWALEVRVCAEDPARGFLPATGIVRRLRLPSGPGLRWDGGIEDGSVVTAHYDSLLGKLCAWGPDRAAALARLVGGLAELRIEGVTTNVDFLARVLGDPAFCAGELHTGFVEERAESLLRPRPEAPELLAVAAVLGLEGGAAGNGGRHAAGASGFASAGAEVPSRWRSERPPFVWIR
ncbi:MAG: ATP-grasp domain-containing protein [Gemmatimonadetes bacterium]|nr:ATP-grasp domain-containing protein [Gemmatimonadota bacterium]